LQLLRIASVSHSRAAFRKGVRLFENAKISSDARTSTMDSLLVEMRSMPADETSCHRNPGNLSCPPLFHLSSQLVANNSLELYMKPGKIVVTGLGDVTIYELILQDVTIQVDDVDPLLNTNSVIEIRVYISDQNGISSSSKLATASISNSVRRRKRVTRRMTS